MADDRLIFLIIDDEMATRLMVKAHLRQFNVDFLETKDGNKGLDLMKNSTVDLVIIDYSMPIISGQEILDIMLEDDKLQNIPAILYTSGGFSKEVEDKLKMSSTAFLEKMNLGKDLIPIIIDILGDRFRKEKD